MKHHAAARQQKRTVGMSTAVGDVSQVVPSKRAKVAVAIVGVACSMTYVLRQDQPLGADIVEGIGNFVLVYWVGLKLVAQWTNRR